MTRRLFLAGLPLAAAAIPPIRGLSRTNLLEYHENGQIKIARPIGMCG